MSALQMVCVCVVRGPLTSSLFPEVEAWLRTSKHAKALRKIAPPREDEYKSVLDWLYCETFPQMKPACIAYYNDEGPPLDEMIGEARIQFEQRVLLRVLQRAYKAVCEEEALQWGALTHAAETMLLLAPEE